MSMIVAALLAVALMTVVLAVALATGILQFRPPDDGRAAVSPSPALVTDDPIDSPELSPEPSPDASPSPSPLPTGTAIPTTTAAPSPGGTHIVASGETLFSISVLYDVPMAAIIEANGITNPDLLQVGQELIIPTAADATPGPVVHIVKTGDTVVAIALQYDVDPTDLADFNYISDWNLIFVGQQLWIPGTEPDGWERPTPLPSP